MNEPRPVSGLRVMLIAAGLILVTLIAAWLVMQRLDLSLQPGAAPDSAAGTD